MKSHKLKFFFVTKKYSNGFEWTLRNILKNLKCKSTNSMCTHLRLSRPHHEIHFAAKDHFISNTVSNFVFLVHFFHTDDFDYMCERWEQRSQRQNLEKRCLASLAGHKKMTKVNAEKKFCKRPLKPAFRVCRTKLENPHMESRENPLWKYPSMPTVNMMIKKIEASIRDST